MCRDHWLCSSLHLQNNCIFEDGGRNPSPFGGSIPDPRVSEAELSVLRRFHIELDPDSLDRGSARRFADALREHVMASRNSNEADRQERLAQLVVFAAKPILRTKAELEELIANGIEAYTAGLQAIADNRDGEKWIAWQAVARVRNEVEALLHEYNVRLKRPAK